ncbi:hypothetical protein ACTWQF_08365 [Streptomyces sp. 8N114]
MAQKNEPSTPTGHTPGTAPWLKGEIDEFRLYGRALTGRDIAGPAQPASP